MSTNTTPQTTTPDETTGQDNAPASNLDVLALVEVLQQHAQRLNALEASTVHLADGVLHLAEAGSEGDLLATLRREVQGMSDNVTRREKRKRISAIIESQKVRARRQAGRVLAAFNEPTE